MKEKLIFSSIDTVKIDYICSVLKENNIPYIKKTAGAGDYLTIAAGNLFNNSTEIFVSEEDFKKASELVSIVDDANDNNEIEKIPEELKDISQEEEIKMQNEADKIKGYLKRFILFFVIIPTVIVFVSAIISSLINR